MKKGMLTLTVAALLALPVAGLAMGMGMEHGSMKMDATMIMLPMQTIEVS